MRRKRACVHASPLREQKLRLAGRYRSHPAQDKHLCFSTDFLERSSRRVHAGQHTLSCIAITSVRVHAFAKALPLLAIRLLSNFGHLQSPTPRGLLKKIQKPRCRCGYRTETIQGVRNRFNVDERKMRHRRIIKFIKWISGESIYGFCCADR